MKNNSTQLSDTHVATSPCWFHLLIVALYVLLCSTEPTSAAPLQFGNWTNPTTMPTARSQAVAVTDPTTGKIYVAGGFADGNAFSTADVYDPAANAWSPLQSMPIATRGATAVYNNNKVYVFGGFGQSVVSAVQIYDIAADTWSQSVFPAAQWESAAVASNGKIYLFGGEGELNQTVEFDPTSLTSSTKGADANGQAGA